MSVRTAELEVVAIECIDSECRTITGDLFSDTVRITARATMPSEPWTFSLPIELATTWPKSDGLQIGDVLKVTMESAGQEGE